MPPSHIASVHVLKAEALRINYKEYSVFSFLRLTECSRRFATAEFHKPGCKKAATAKDCERVECAGCCKEEPTPCTYAGHNKRRQQGSSTALAQPLVLVSYFWDQINLPLYFLYALHLSLKIQQGAPSYREATLPLRHLLELRPVLSLPLRRSYGASPGTLHGARTIASWRRREGSGRKPRS